MVGVINKGKAQKFFRILILVVFLSIFSFLFITPVTSANSEFLGQYQYTMYVVGYGFTGKTGRTLSETTQSISTYFGTYPDVTIISHSDYKLSSSGGSIKISNYKAYYDQDFNLRKSESTWDVDISGYYPETDTFTYEYGNYVVLQNTPTVYEETYTQRYYLNGYYEDSTACRDYMTLDGTEFFTVVAGTFNCTRFKTMHYEDSSYVGYGMAWFAESGTLIKQVEWDENGYLLMTVTLVSTSPPFPTWATVLIVLGAIGGTILCIALYVRSRRQNEIASPEKKVSPMFKSPYESIHSTTVRSTSPPPYKFTSPPTIKSTSPPIKSSGAFSDCPFCSGTGMIKSGYGFYSCPYCKMRRLGEQ